jgi:hypothetical protein
MLNDTLRRLILGMDMGRESSRAADGHQAGVRHLGARRPPASPSSKEVTGDDHAQTTPRSSACRPPGPIHSSARGSQGAL